MNIGCASRPRVGIFLFAALSAAIAPFSTAGTSGMAVKTALVGYVTVRSTPGSTAAFSVPLHAGPVANGKITSATADSVTDAGASFGSLANTHFIRICSGQARGRCMLILSNTATTLGLDTGAGSFALPADNSGGNTASVAPGDHYEIVPMLTLGNIFGAAGDSVKTHPDPALADEVAVHYQGATRIYYHDGTRWRNASDTNDLADYHSEPLPPGATLRVARREGGQAVDLVFQGTVSDPVRNFQLPGGMKAFAGMDCPVDATLAKLRFREMPGWTPGAAPSRADQVTIYSPDGAFHTFFVDTSGAWRNAANPSDVQDKSSFPIPAGSTCWFVRRGSAVGSLANCSSQPLYHIDASP